jgi:hypothetical protein
VDVVPAPRAAPQPHVRPIGEAVHRGRRVVVPRWASGLALLCCEAERGRREREEEQQSRAEQVLFATVSRGGAISRQAAQVGCCIARQLAGRTRAGHDSVRKRARAHPKPPGQDLVLRDHARIAAGLGSGLGAHGGISSNRSSSGEVSCIVKNW